MKSYKMVNGEGTPEDLITSAISEIEELKEELESWMSNMEGTNLESGDKYQMLSDAVSELEGVTLPSPDEWPHSMSVIAFSYSIPKRKTRQPSRVVRLENAIVKVGAVIEFYESLDNGAEEYEDLLSELREIEQISVEIPGMYG